MQKCAGRSGSLKVPLRWIPTAYRAVEARAHDVRPGGQRFLDDPCHAYATWSLFG